MRFMQASPAWEHRELACLYGRLLPIIKKAMPIIPKPCGWRGSSKLVYLRHEALIEEMTNAATNTHSSQIPALATGEGYSGQACGFL